MSLCSRRRPTVAAPLIPCRPSDNGIGHAYLSIASRARVSGCLSILDLLQTPVAGDALELMLPTVSELDARSGDEIPDGAGHHDLSRVCLGADPSGYMDGEASQVIAAHLAFACMQTGADVDAKFSRSVKDGLGAADRTSGAVKGREEAVPSRVDLTSTKPPELIAYRAVVGVEHRSPALVA